MKKTAIVITLLALAVFAPAIARATHVGVNPGNLAPEFSFQDTSGKWVSLSDFRGKKVFLFSWATWCRCREQLPALQEFYKKHKSAGFEVIAVASDSQGLKWVKPYLDKAGAKYVALIDPNNELPVKYNFSATENGFLIDEGGVIRMSIIGFDIRNEKHLNQLLESMKKTYAVTKGEDRKSLDEMIASYEAGLEKNPGAFPKRLELAEFYRRKGDFRNAERTLRKAVELKSRNAEAHYRLGVILYQQGRIEEGVSEWEKAFKLDSGNYIYMRNIEAYRNPEIFYEEVMK
jgi:peroxiredoxin